MARIKNSKYLAYVRSFPCLVCGRQAQAHHLQIAYNAGMAQKVHDNLTVPLCGECHMALHDFGNERTWWALQGIDPEAWAATHWKEYSNEQEAQRN